MLHTHDLIFFTTDLQKVFITQQFTARVDLFLKYKQNFREQLKNGIEHLFTQYSIRKMNDICNKNKSQCRPVIFKWSIDVHVCCFFQLSVEFVYCLILIEVLTKVSLTSS